MDFQERAWGRRERYLVVDLLHECVSSLRGRRKSKLNRISVIRSFFKHNRVELPSDPAFRVDGDDPPVTGNLNIEALRKILLATDRRYRAVFLIMFQSGMGEQEFMYFNCHWQMIRKQLRKEVIRIDLPGRKHARNARPYYTYVGGDGVRWLKEYLTKERGPIKPGDPIFLNDRGNPVTKVNIRRAFTRAAAKAGLIRIATPDCPQCGGETIKRRIWHEGKTKTLYRCLKCNVQTFASQVPKKMEVRYGVNPHEMRDLFRSEWELSPARAVAAEFCCPPWSYIWTLDGPKPIAELSFNDRVYADDGKFHQVIATFRRPFAGELIRIQPRILGGFASEVTPNHPVLSVKLNDCPIHGRSIHLDTRHRHCDCLNPENYQLRFYKAKELEKGDLIAFPLPQFRSPPSEFSNEQLKLFGYYVAEGSSYQRRVRFSFGKHELDYIDEVNKILETYYYRKPTLETTRRGSGINIILYNGEVARWFKQQFGPRARRKRIPPWLIALPKEQVCHFLKGLWNGDGCTFETSNHKAFSLSTSSKGLAIQVALLLLRLGIRPTVQKVNCFTPKGSPTRRWHVRVRNFREVVKMAKLLSKPIGKTVRKKSKRECVYHQHYLLLPIFKLERIPYSGPVYNMEVAKRNTFVVDGMAVHNCMGHNIDPNEYNKIMKLHPEWAEEQYRLAESYLNVLSEEPRKISASAVRDLERINKKLVVKIKKLEAEMEIQKQRELKIERTIKRLEEVEKQIFALTNTEEK